MTQTTLQTSPEQTVTDLAHFAWCAQVALRMAQRDGQAGSSLGEHTFLIRWLASAQKLRRFPRTVAPDIASLLELGRRRGIAANLHQRLEYLWFSCSAPLSNQSDLFRLTWAIEKLKSLGWCNAVVSDEEWNTPALKADYCDSQALLTRKSALQQQYTEKGELKGDVLFLLNGESAEFTEAFTEAGLSILLEEDSAGWKQALLRVSP